MTDWLMVIITAIYVVATIFICRANMKSAEASKEQLIEMQRQYAEGNRPYIETEFCFLNRMWYVVRFVNHGRFTAQHVKITLSQEFIDSLPEQNFREILNKLKTLECIIGVGQHHDLFIGSIRLQGNPNMKPLIGKITYESNGNLYESDIFVDLEHYMTFYSTDSEQEKFLKALKENAKELEGIKRSLLSLTDTLSAKNEKNEDTDHA